MTDVAEQRTLAPYDLSGNVAIVTGGGRGIGRTYSIWLAKSGCRVAIADLLAADDVVGEIEAAGGEACSVPTDVTVWDSVDRLTRDVFARWGRIDILVNNAGYFRDAQRGTWLTCKAVAPIMKAQRRGRIVNVSSQVVMRGTAGFLHYVAAKSAVIGMTRALARELGDFEIGVNAVAPDWVPHDLEYAAAHPEIDERIIATRALKRTMVPEDLVGTVLYLVGPGSSFVTGQTILVNGGSVFQ